MFDSLADQIKQDQKGETSNTQRLIFWAVLILLSVVVFGGLYYGVRMLE